MPVPTTRKFPAGILWLLLPWVSSVAGCGSNSHDPFQLLTPEEQEGVILLASNAAEWAATMDELAAIHEQADALLQARQGQTDHLPWPSARREMEAMHEARSHLIDALEEMAGANYALLRAVVESTVSNPDDVDAVIVAALDVAEDDASGPTWWERFGIVTGLLPLPE